MNQDVDFSRLDHKALSSLKGLEEVLGFCKENEIVISKNIFLEAVVERVLKELGVTGIDVNIPNAPERVLEVLGGLSRSRAATINNFLTNEVVNIEELSERQLDATSIPMGELDDALTRYQLMLDNGVEPGAAANKVVAQYKGVLPKTGLDDAIKGYQETKTEVEGKLSKGNDIEGGIKQAQTKQIAVEVAREAAKVEVQVRQTTMTTASPEQAKLVANEAKKIVTEGALVATLTNRVPHSEVERGAARVVAGIQNNAVREVVLAAIREAPQTVVAEVNIGKEAESIADRLVAELKRDDGLSDLVKAREERLRSVVKTEVVQAIKQGTGTTNIGKRVDEVLGDNGEEALRVTRSKPRTEKAEDTRRAEKVIEMPAAKAAIYQRVDEVLAASVVLDSVRKTETVEAIVKQLRSDPDLPVLENLQPDSLRTAVGNKVEEASRELAARPKELVKGGRGEQIITKEVERIWNEGEMSDAARGRAVVVVMGELGKNGDLTGGDKRKETELREMVRSQIDLGVARKSLEAVAVVEDTTVQRILDLEIERMVTGGQEVSAASKQAAVEAVVKQLGQSRKIVGVTGANLEVLKRAIEKQVEIKIGRQQNQERTGSRELETTSRTAARNSEIEIERYVKSHWQEIRFIRTVEVSGQIENGFFRQNPRLTPEQATAVRNFSDKAAALFYTRRALNWDGFSETNLQAFIAKGGSLQDYYNLKAMTAMLKMNKDEFATWRYEYTENRAALGKILLPYSESVELAAIQNVMQVYNNDFSARLLMNASQGFSQIQDFGGRINSMMATVDGWTNGWLSRSALGQFAHGLEERAFNYLGKQVANEFISNSLTVLGKEGLQQGMRSILQGVLSGGVKAAATSAAAGTAAAAAGTAAGTALGVATGPIGWVVAAAGILGKAAGAILERLGINAGRWLRDNLGGLVGGTLEAGVNLVILGLGGLLAGVAVIGVGAAVLVGPLVMGGLFVKQKFLVSRISTMVPQMGQGEINPNGPSTPGRPIGGRVDAKCQNADLGGMVNWGIKQNKGDWANKQLPQGCTFAESGCGPSSVAKVLMTKDASLNPYNVVYETDSPYSTMGCPGSSFSQHQLSLEKHLGAGSVEYSAFTQGCTKKDIANWICDGKIVLMLGNFIYNGGVGGHFALAVKLVDGEVYLSDPYYDDSEPQLDGQAKRGHVQSIISCLTIDASKVR